MNGVLRLPSEEELRSVEDSLKGYGASMPTGLTLLVHELSYREVYAFHDRRLFDVAKHISIHRNVYFAGLFAGSFRHNSFRLSLEMAEELYRLRSLENVVEVDEDQERSFLYGRSIKLPPRDAQKLVGKSFVVINALGDVLGLARYEALSHSLVNLVDKGWYLRKGH